MNVWIEEIKDYDLNGTLSSTNYLISYERIRKFLGIKWVDIRYVKEEHCGMGDYYTSKKTFTSIEEAEKFIFNDLNPLKINVTDKKIVKYIFK